jgi:chromosome segregation ATPase
VSDLDLSLDDCLDLLGAGRNHKARLELESLRTAYATVQAERDITRAALEKVSELFDDKVRDLANTMHELATLRETLVGLREPLERAEQKLKAYVGVCTGDKELTEAVLPMVGRAITIIKGTP